MYRRCIAATGKGTAIGGAVLITLDGAQGVHMS